MNKNLIFILIILTFIFAGCQGQRQTETLDQICLQNIYKQDAMEKAEQCLTRMHFQIEKLDFEQGYIRTKPLTGAQWFEIWRNDNVGGFDKAEANLQDIRRTVELNFGPMEDKLCINCIVTTERLSLPERRIASSTQAYAMFTKNSRGSQQLRLDSMQKQNAEWINLGEDSGLETKILCLIQEKL